MHRFRLLKKVVIVLLILVSMPMASYGKSHVHHGNHGATMEVSGPPSLKTASTPSAYFQQDSRLWLAWFHKGHIYVNYSDDLAKSFSQPVRVNSKPENIHHNGEARPKIAVDDAGRIFIAYTQKLPKRFTGNIRFSRSLDGGKTFSEPVTVNDNLDIISHRFVSMVLDASGKLYLTWLDARDFLAAKKKGVSYSGSALYYTYSEDNGETFHANIKLADNTCQCCRIALALDKEQQPVILWRHIFSSGVLEDESDKSASRDHALLHLDRTTNDVSLKRVSFENWQAESCPHHGPSLTIAENGRYHMTWFNLLEGKPGIFYAHTDDKGKTLSPVYRFAGGEDQAQHPVVLDLNGTTYLSWKTFDGKKTDIKLMTSSDGGIVWNKPHSVANTEKQSDYPFLMGHKGHVYLAWHIIGEGYRLIRIDE